MATLIGWNKKNSGGLFTFGGKATLIYAIKLGINRIERNSINNGLKNNIKVIVSSDAHYSIENICSLLGIGLQNCIRLKNKVNEESFLIEFENTINSIYENNGMIAAVMLSGGNSLNLDIDPIKEVYNILERFKIKYQQEDRIYLHVDAVIGWGWLCFKHYNFEKNKYQISPVVLDKLKRTYQKIREVHYADSIGIDFHKIGMCPYISSLFLCKNREELYNINNIEFVSHKENLLFGNNFVQGYSIEHSRSGDGIVAAWASLETLGIEGYQKYIIKLSSIKESFIDVVDKGKSFSILNRGAAGFCVVFVPRVKNIDDIEKNMYIKKLFDYITIKTRNKKENIVIGYVPEYFNKETNSFGSALKVYFMNPFIKSKEVIKIVNLLDKFHIECFKDTRKLKKKSTIENSRLYPK